MLKTEIADCCRRLRLGKNVATMLYVKDGCPYCRKQIEQLEREGRSYRLHNVSDRSALKEAREKYGAGMVPVVVEDGKVKAIGFQG